MVDRAKQVSEYYARDRMLFHTATLLLCVKCGSLFMILQGGAEEAEESREGNEAAAGQAAATGHLEVRLACMLVLGSITLCICKCCCGRIQTLS